MQEIKILHHGRKADGCAYRPEGAGRFPLMIMSHGYNGHHSDQAHMAEYLMANGIGAVCYTFCGGSLRDRSGFPTTEMTLFTEKQDLLAVLDEVRCWEWVDTERIYLFGSSQGGMVSALAAEERRDQIKGMFLQYPAFCIADDWREKFPRKEDIPDEFVLWDMTLGRVFSETVHDFVVEEETGGFDKPILIVHGTEDDVVPISYSEQAVKRYPNARLEVFPGEGHGFTPAGEQRTEEMVLAFVREQEFHGYDTFEDKA